MSGTDARREDPMLLDTRRSSIRTAILAVRHSGLHTRERRSKRKTRVLAVSPYTRTTY
jgi:hypothetical protein